MITVGLVQADIKAYNKKGNLAHYSEWLESAIQEPVHLLVFPEMFHCGFSPDIQADAEQHNGEGVYFLYLMACKFECDVVATIPVKQNGLIYNRLVWLSRDRILGSYDKHHLFLGEEEFFTPGTQKTIIQSLGYKFLPLICFDVRFPEWSRNRVINNQFDYDCLVYTANFPAPREQELMALARARAIENQAYALVVNRVGTDGYQRKYNGGCSIINPHGEIEAQTTTQKEEILIHSCDFDAVKSLREQFPISKFW
jgi:predicted amidohydrolase